VITAILICAALILAWFAVYSWSTASKRTAPHQLRHVPFADPADDSDPYGEEFIAQLTGGPDWWDEDPPPVRVEVLTGPGRRIAQTSELTLSVLARVRDRLAEMSADEDDPEIDDTGRIPHAEGTWGKTASEMTSELAARYMT
jgi:hypothetical protein